MRQKISAERAHLKRRQYKRRAKAVPPSPPLTIADYIANCIHHVLAAPCDGRRWRDRERDLAEAVAVAAREGLGAAHSYLVTLAREAGEGKYRDAPPPAGND